MKWDLTFDSWECLYTFQSPTFSVSKITVWCTWGIFQEIYLFAVFIDIPSPETTVVTCVYIVGRWRCPLDLTQSSSATTWDGRNDELFPKGGVIPLTTHLIVNNVFHLLNNSYKVLMSRTCCSLTRMRIPHCLNKLPVIPSPIPLLIPFFNSLLTGSLDLFLATPQVSTKALTNQQSNSWFPGLMWSCYVLLSTGTPFFLLVPWRQGPSPRCLPFKHCSCFHHLYFHLVLRYLSVGSSQVSTLPFLCPLSPPLINQNSMVFPSNPQVTGFLS